MITRPVFYPLVQRLHQPRQLIQVLVGPRDVGKTTLAHQAMKAFSHRATYASADGPAAGDELWLEQQWEIARHNCRQSGSWLLVLDEVERVPRWAELVRRMWDRDTEFKLEIRMLLIGSSTPLVDRGLVGPLAGRFEVSRVGHWSFTEMRETFDWTLDQFLYYGGLPGVANRVGEEESWRRYLLDSLIETCLARDVLSAARVDKPALLRSLFRLGCEQSGEVLSYQKMTSLLPGAGNTTTLAGYLNLLAGAGMLRGIEKFHAGPERERGSTPKLQVFTTGFTTAQAGTTFARTRNQPELWGRLVESAIGAHLAQAAMTGEIDDLTYWRERNRDVDFVLRLGERMVTIDVKTGRRKASLPGIATFHKRSGPERSFLVGGEGIPVEEFLQFSPRELFG